MKIIEQRFKNLSVILNQNINVNLTVREWTFLIDKTFPYKDLKPDHYQPSHSCAKGSHQQTNGTYLTLLSMMGFTERTFVLIGNNKKPFLKFKVLKEVPYRKLLNENPKTEN